MLALFVVFMFGPMVNEGGVNAVIEKGPMAALEQAWEDREPLDYSKMNP